MLRAATAAIVLFLALSPTLADGADEAIGIHANTSFWWTPLEQVENGLVQAGSGDAAADNASGFNFRQGRLAFTFASRDEKFEGLLRIRLEERTDLIDFWGAYHPRPSMGIYIGQMKIPSTAEVLTPDHRLDFISRSSFGKVVCDYSLSRTPYISAVMAAKSYDRDLGLAFRGDFPIAGGARLRLFMMVANGLGGNKYIGADESSEFVYSNRFGDYYYGSRVELSPISALTLGAHASINRHENMAVGSRGPVFDMDRRVWTCDMAAELPWKERIGAFFGSGSIDDFWEATSYAFDYRGWGAWAIQPLLEKKIELGIRYDALTTEFNSDGDETDRRDWTFGINFIPSEYIRVQMNYVLKDTVNEYEPDLDDDILFMNFQFIFE